MIIALSGFFQCVLLVMMIYYTNAIPNLYHSIIFYFSSNPTPESIQSEQEVQSLINS